MTIAALPPVAALSVVVADFSGTISLGGVIILFVTVASAAWINTRRKSDNAETKRVLELAEATAAAWKLERDAEVAKNARLLDDLATERTRCTEALTEVAKLRERTDVTQLAETLSSTVSAHEAGAASRSEAVLAAITALPERLAAAVQQLNGP